MPANPLNDFKIWNYYQKEPRVNGVLPVHNLPKMKDGTYAINLD